MRKQVKTRLTHRTETLVVPYEEVLLLNAANYVEAKIEYIGYNEPGGVEKEYTTIMSIVRDYAIGEIRDSMTKDNLLDFRAARDVQSIVTVEPEGYKVEIHWLQREIVEDKNEASD